MKTEINLSPAADMVIENVQRPAMDTQPARTAGQETARDALVRLNILARRQERWDRRAARA
ncbi:hypothetical protein HHI_05285 [Hyphomonas hirschiana VP5]|uniref:Uncharacterized protein n=1 Tax=Hyphomonas hirschiana VP5 TaxID=1280951 RepID=A0A059FYN8_9PROT|nr:MULTISPECIES: hypothetical protein [Hyphomonas]KCZ95543.1 hypothetical protein HHI_05285 [Hyphomonas hirschiana VP5]